MGEVLLTALLVGIVAFVAGFFVQPYLARQKAEKAQQDAAQILLTAENKQKEILLEAKNEAFKLKEKSEQDAARLRQEALDEQKRLHQKEEALDKRYETIEQKLQQVENTKKQVDEINAALIDKQKEMTQRLSLIHI